MKSQADNKIFRLGAVDDGLLFAMRVCLLSLALVTATFYTYEAQGSAVLNWQEAYTGLAILFGVSVLTGFWILNRKSRDKFSRLGFFVDVLLVTALIYFTGGSFSPLLFLYLPLAMLATALVGRNFALVLSLSSVLFYLGMLEAVQRSWLPSVTNDLNLHLSDEKLAFQVLGLLSGIVLVIASVDYLRTKLSYFWVQAELAESSLRDLITSHQSVIDQIPDGVILTDGLHVIKKVNSSAAELFECNPEKLIGQNLQDLISGHADSAVKIRLTEQASFEVSFKRKNNSVVRLSYSRKAIGEPIDGWLHVLVDITLLKVAQDKLDLQEKMARLLSEKRVVRNSSNKKTFEFVGESVEMQEVFNMIQRTAPSSANVLIFGESGTGKELVAKAIHLDSPASSGPFVAVNCGAIPENLIESALFGHIKGSFTGAVADQSGYFVQANNGTLFLDEIGELPLSMQAKLLRVLQERVVRPIGAKSDIPVRIRVVSASNKELAEEVRKGTFREDLFYRLNVISIDLPALRHRKTDIPLLVNSILKRLVSDDRIPVVSPPAMELLMAYDYPGNVRELENIIERALVLGGEVIIEEYLPDCVRASTQLRQTNIIIDEELELPVNLDDILASVERKYLEKAMMLARGLRKNAAEMLGINFRSLRYRLDKFGEGNWWDPK